LHPCLSHILTTNLFSHTTLNPLFVRWGVSHTLPKKKKGRTGLAASEHLLGLDGATPPGLLYLYISFGYDCRARSLLPRWAWVSHTLVGPLTPTQKKNTFLYSIHFLFRVTIQSALRGPSMAGARDALEQRNGHVIPLKKVCIVLFLCSCGACLRLHVLSGSFGCTPSCELLGIAL